MTFDQTPELARLGDDLERATTSSLAAGRRRRRTIRTAVVVAAVAAFVTGTAAIAGVFSPAQVAAGMPAGAMIFDQTDPACALDGDGVTYHCTLARAPQEPGAGITPPPGKDVGPVEAASYVDSKEVLALNGLAAGGCIGRSADGLRWDCYIGQEAVDRLIISQDFLNEPILGPGKG